MTSFFFSGTYIIKTWGIKRMQQHTITNLTDKLSFMAKETNLLWWLNVK